MFTNLNTIELADSLFNYDEYLNESNDNIKTLRITSELAFRFEKKELPEEKRFVSFIHESIKFFPNLRIINVDKVLTLNLFKEIINLLIDEKFKPCFEIDCIKIM